MAESKTTPKAVNEQEAIESAYNLGYHLFEGSIVVEEDNWDFSHYTDTAEYANRVLPSLRQYAGYGEGVGPGTHTANREVLLETDEGSVETTAQRVLDTLVDAFETGARDAATGSGQNPRAE